MIYIGIDVAKAKHDCCIIDSTGVILNDSLRISNSREGFELLYSSILFQEQARLHHKALPIRLKPQAQL